MAPALTAKLTASTSILMLNVFIVVLFGRMKWNWQKRQRSTDVRQGSSPCHGANGRVMPAPINRD
jgi:hypothetical protein